MFRVLCFKKVRYQLLAVRGCHSCNPTLKTYVDQIWLPFAVNSQVPFFKKVFMFGRIK